MTEHTLKKSQKNKRIKPVSKLDAFKGLLLLLIVFGFLGFSMSNVSAAEITKATVSYGGKKNQLDDDTRNLVIAQNSNSKVYDQLIGKAQNKTRNAIIIEKQNTISKSTTAKGLVKSNASQYERYYTPEFTVYDANSFLEDDIDGDGYYQTFGVIFDVDVYNPNGNEESVIYAELYLSENGGSWEHYYTTEEFLISGNNTEDQFEVITTLAEGYRANNYDVLIDIYEVGYAEVVATYSSDDSNALYALPLESNDNDQVYVDEVIVVHGGSTSIVFLLLTTGLAFVRRVITKSL